MPVIITADFPPAHGGIQRYAERLAQSIHRQGLPLAVIAPDQPEAASYDASLPFRVFRYPRGNRFTQACHMWRRLTAALEQTADHRLIATTWNPTGLVASLFTRLVPRTKLTVMAMGSEIARQDDPLRFTLLRWTLAGHDIVAISRYTASLLAERGIHQRVRVIPCGVDPLPASDIPAPKAAQPTVISVGRLVRRKGYDRLIQALPLLSADLPEARLVIVGDGPDRPYLERLAKDQGVGERVIFVGNVDDQTLARLYQEAWCFAMPNRRDGYEVEGFGIVFLEAALHGLPTLGGRDSGAEDAIAEPLTGLLADGSDTQDVARGLRQLLADPIIARQMGQRGRERALTSFQWSEIAQRIVRESSRTV